MGNMTTTCRRCRPPAATSASAARVARAVRVSPGRAAAYTRTAPTGEATASGRSCGSGAPGRGLGAKADRAAHPRTTTRTARSVPRQPRATNRPDRRTPVTIPRARRTAPVTRTATASQYAGPLVAMPVAVRSRSAATTSRGRATASPMPTARRRSRPAAAAGHRLRPSATTGWARRRTVRTTPAWIQAEWGRADGRRPRTTATDRTTRVTGCSVRRACRPAAMRPVRADRGGRRPWSEAVGSDGRAVTSVGAGAHAPRRGSGGVLACRRGRTVVVMRAPRDRS
ncbi:exported hypothetical protein [Nostocoides japonicum T1-X7]|uniref:Uncharacterized protein n=1 Tax=Nostocoides japonicum T1-X7 TaxID=1194083 RepID=A0A077M1G9_9MICO|nr:exported hypothetical protein [Tetrasphaera japonica T1-X7]